MVRYFGFSPPQLQKKKGETKAPALYTQAQARRGTEKSPFLSEKENSKAPQKKKKGGAALDPAQRKPEENHEWQLAPGGVVRDVSVKRKGLSAKKKSRMSPVHTSEDSKEGKEVAPCPNGVGKTQILKKVRETGRNWR